jgi:hypothetical protein
MVRDDPDDSEVAERVKRVMAYAGYDDCGGFATFLGVEYNRLNNVLNGSPLSKPLAFRMVQRIPGLTTDWLWFGEASGLPMELVKSLGGLPAGSEKAKT